MAVAELKAALLKLDKERNAISADIALAKEQLGPVGTDAPLVDAEGFPRADVDLLAVRTLRQRVVVLTNDYKAKQREIDSLLQQLHALGPAAFVAAKPTFADGAGASADGAASGGAGALAAGPAAAAAVDGPGRADRPAVALEAAFRGLALPDDAAAYSPFARVDEVSPGSPAADAGLQVGDRIAVFGTLVALAPAGAGAGAGSAAAARPPTLSDLGSLVRASQDVALPVVVLRAAGGGAGAGAGHAALRLVLTPRPWSGAGLLGCHVVPAT